MNARAVVLQLLLSAMTATVGIVFYHLFVLQGARQFGFVDVAEVYRAKEKSLVEMVTKPTVTEEDKQRAIEAAGEFAKRLPTALEQLTAECQCVVLVRAAVAAPTPDMLDLTPQLRQKIGI